MHTADRPAPTPRAAKDCIRAVVEELRLDTTDPFTRLLAIACGMQDAHSETKAALSRCQDEVHRLRDELSAAKAEAERLREALEKVERWQFPPTGKFWESGTPVSYGAAYGSNGERDYMRNVARAALAAPRKEEGNA